MSGIRSMQVLADYLQVSMQLTNIFALQSLCASMVNLRTTGGWDQSWAWVHFRWPSQSNPIHGWIQSMFNSRWDHLVDLLTTWVKQKDEIGTFRRIGLCDLAAVRMEWVAPRPSASFRVRWWWWWCWWWCCECSPTAMQCHLCSRHGSGRAAWRHPRPHRMKRLNNLMRGLDILRGCIDRRQPPHFWACPIMYIIMFLLSVYTVSQKMHSKIWR